MIISDYLSIKLTDFNFPSAFLMWIVEVLRFVLFFADMRRDVQEIFRNTPHGKQVMMFSATLSKDIRPVCKKFMQDVIELLFIQTYCSHTTTTTTTAKSYRTRGTN